MPPNTAASRQVRVLLRCAVVIKPIFRSGTVIDRRWGGVKEGRCCKKTALSITAGIRPALDVSTVPKQNGVGKVWRARRVRQEECGAFPYVACCWGDISAIIASFSVFEHFLESLWSLFV